MEEIIEAVYHEIKSTGLEKRLIAGIVLTGGGAMLKHIEQLTQFVTGMDTRIGYPNEHLASTAAAEMTSPMYSTALGLVLIGMQRTDFTKTKNDEETPEVIKPTKTPSVPGRGKMTEWLDKFFGDGIS
jgi:cell division protein FtsA